MQTIDASLNFTLFDYIRHISWRSKIPECDSLQNDNDATCLKIYSASIERKICKVIKFVYYIHLKIPYYNSVANEIKFNSLR